MGASELVSSFAVDEVSILSMTLLNTPCFDVYRYLKKVVLQDMMIRGEVQKVQILQGKLNKEGQRMDAISSKGYDRTSEPNIAKQKNEWRWRLIPADMIENHKRIVAQFLPKPKKPKRNHRSRSG
jgi:hypothetical protein